MRQSESGGDVGCQRKGVTRQRGLFLEECEKESLTERVEKGINSEGTSPKDKEVLTEGGSLGKRRRLVD